MAVNSVTLGDYERPLQIGNFIKDLFAGFQLLNLKNDILRKRSDGIKYSVSAIREISTPLTSPRAAGTKQNVHGHRSANHFCFFSPCLVMQVKKVEDVVYDLSLRGLVPKSGAAV